jgi:uncharacterized SAM-binding protein YcdF (DUF218 family)
VKRRVARRWRILLIAVLAVAAISPFVAWVAAKLLIVRNDLPSADAIVVLSGPATYLERGDWAARLYREGRAPVVVLSNEGLTSTWSQTEERNLYFYELASRELRQRGVPTKDIQVVSQIGAGTYQESLKVCDYATTHKLKRLLVVTSAYHSRRALWSLHRACQRYEIQIGIESPPPGWQTPSPGFWWLSKWGWRVVAGEYVKMIYYRWRY